MDLGLSAKVALITGAGRGIGKAEAMALVTEGAKVAINDIAAEQAHETADQINAMGGTAKAFAADVSDASAVESMVENIYSDFGSIDILVNNAGAGAKYWGRPVEDLPVESWDIIINTHLRSTFLCSKYVAPRMKKQRSGRIVLNERIGWRTARCIKLYCRQGGYNWANSQYGQGNRTIWCYR
jgi:3-oxoacyl-[acyl-carrier protein] reductase